MTENEIAKQIVDAAYRIHQTLGPGLLESVYEALLVYELESRGLRTIRQWEVPVVYEQIRIQVGLRADLLVEDKVIVEGKIRRCHCAGPQKTVADVSEASGQASGAAHQL